MAMENLHVLGFSLELLHRFEESLRKTTIKNNKSMSIKKDGLENIAYHVAREFRKARVHSILNLKHHGSKSKNNQSFKQ